jgi:hypothetical protein
MTITYKKDPDAVERFTIDWSDRLGAATISTSAWSQLPLAELTVNNDSEDDTTTSVFIAGGTVDDVHVITNRITTSVGETLDQSFRLVIKAA